MTHVLTVIKKEEVNIWLTCWTLHAQGWDVHWKISTAFESQNSIFVAAQMQNMTICILMIWITGVDLSLQLYTNLKKKKKQEYML